MNNSGHSADIKVSIIVPVYNVAPYIKDCLESLIHQTLQEIEIILINDASTDASGAICDTYAQKDSRIIVIHREVNVRQGRSRNEGIALARGEFIGFVDPDDWVDLTFYERLYTAAKKNGAQIVKGETKVTDEYKKITSSSKLNQWIRRELKQKKKLFHVFTYQHCSAIYDRSFIQQHHILYADIRNGEDGIFLLQATFYCDRYCLIDDVYYYYRSRGDSTVAVKELAYYQSFLDYYDIFLAFVNNQIMSERDYQWAIYNTIQFMRMGYRELVTSGKYPEFETTYINHIFSRTSQYKLHGSYLLENFFPPALSIKRQLFVFVKNVCIRIGLVL
jgi:glycosyltransferase involved in cell wall biosynthesis